MLNITAERTTESIDFIVVAGRQYITLKIKISIIWTINRNMHHFEKVFRNIFNAALEQQIRFHGLYRCGKEKSSLDE